MYVNIYVFFSCRIKFFAKHNLSVAQELIEGTIHCKPGAAERLVQDIYSLLTNRW